jgi:hypothetical protein
MTYDELASALEDAWLAAGLHEHVIEEQVIIERNERSYRAELFADHEEPLPDPAPPWVDVTFRWGPQHQLRGEGHEGLRAPIELTWTYHVELGPYHPRSDQELARAFFGAVRAGFRRLDPNEPPPHDYIEVEVRRSFQAHGDGPLGTWIELVGNGLTDLTDLWSEHDPRVLGDVIRDELQLVAAVLLSLAEVFVPTRGGRGSYRSVETA